MARYLTGFRVGRRAMAWMTAARTMYRPKASLCIIPVWWKESFGWSRREVRYALRIRATSDLQPTPTSDFANCLVATPLRASSTAYL